jgi:hypothetical protein
MKATASLACGLLQVPAQYKVSQELVSLRPLLAASACRSWSLTYASVSPSSSSKSVPAYRLAERTSFQAPQGRSLTTCASSPVPSVALIPNPVVTRFYACRPVQIACRCIRWGDNLAADLGLGLRTIKTPLADHKRIARSHRGVAVSCRYINETRAVVPCSIFMTNGPTAWSSRRSVGMS